MLDDAQKEEKLKAALWYSTGKTVDAVTINQGLNATPHFTGALSEMCWAQIENAAKDLQAFAKHAGRDTIRAEDVLLLARRNDGLKEALEKEAMEVKGRDKR